MRTAIELAQGNDLEHLLRQLQREQRKLRETISGIAQLAAVAVLGYMLFKDEPKP